MNVQALSKTRFADELGTFGFSAVAYPGSLRAVVREAMSSWQQFCSLPDEKKRVLSGGDRVRDFGYMKREDKGPRADTKEQFHAVRKNFPLLLPKAAAINDARATGFINTVDALITAAGPLVEQFAGAVEKAHGLSGFTARVMSSQDNWTFRYLHYPPGGRPIFANAHADRGGFTLHLCETADGGEYFGFDRAWRPWPVSDKQTIIFPSMGLQYYSKCSLKALWHRVVPTAETTAAGRYSMVVFIDFKMDHRFDDSKYRTQEFEPGFNYSLGFDELRKLFVPC